MSLRGDTGRQDAARSNPLQILSHMILPRFLAQPHISRGQRNKRKPHAKPTKRPCPVARKIWSKKIISTVPLERSPEQLNFQFARIQASAFITLPKPIYLLRVVKAPFCSPAASLSSQPTISTPVKMSSYNKDQKDFGEAPVCAVLDRPLRRVAIMTP